MRFCADNLADVLTKSSKKNSFKNESAATPAAKNFTPSQSKTFKTIPKTNNEPAATFAADLTFSQSKILKTTSKINNDMIDLTDNDDKSSTAQLSYDHYADVLKEVSWTKMKEMPPLFRDDE